MGWIQARQRIGLGLRAFFLSYALCEYRSAQNTGGGSNGLVNTVSCIILFSAAESCRSSGVTHTRLTRSVVGDSLMVLRRNYMPLLGLVQIARSSPRSGVSPELTSTENATTDVTRYCSKHTTEFPELPLRFLRRVSTGLRHHASSRDLLGLQFLPPNLQTLASPQPPTDLCDGGHQAGDIRCCMCRWRSSRPEPAQRTA